MYNPMSTLHCAHLLQEEVREQLSLNYVAHSDNRLSAQLVLDFLQFILLAHKDPLVTMVSRSPNKDWFPLQSHCFALQLEEQLMEQPCHVLGCMAEAEFADAMEKIAPGNLDLLSHRLFLQSLLAQESSNSIKQTLPTKKLACILSNYRHRHPNCATVIESPTVITGQTSIKSMQDVFML